ncbi:MAG: tail fiber domain-containing protein, partial [Candidatus Korobacteraceae bacterium]
SNNTFSGYEAGVSNTTGNENTFYGYQAGMSNTVGAGNAFYGYQAGYSNTGDNFGNSFYGYGAGYANTTGQSNTFLGYGAGYYNTTGSADVYISNVGPEAESNTIRIGTYPFQVATYIAGIYGSAVDGNGIPVYVDNNGLLGTVVSSRRFKEQIADMGDSTSALMKLRPVTFIYKPEFAKGDRTLQYGLIAEEVAQVYPELVAYDNDGQPYTVRYQYLTPMLLNEAQKQYRRAEAQADVIKTQEQKIDSQQNQIEEMQQRLSRLEALVGTRTSTAQLDPERRASAGETQ